MSGECPHGISGRTGGTCPNRHPKRCPLYLRWGDRNEKGCSGTTCGKAHPTMCPNSLNLRCFDKFCPWKLHTQRCQRPDTASRRRPPYSGGVWTSQNQREGRRDQYNQHFNGGSRNYGNYSRSYGAGYNQVHQNDTRGTYSQVAGGAGPAGAGAGAGAGTGAGTAPGPAANPGVMGFQGMTAQQMQLGALRLTGFEQQLQEAVTRAILLAFTNRPGQVGWPVMGGVPGGVAAVPPPN